MKEKILLFIFVFCWNYSFNQEIYIIDTIINNGKEMLIFSDNSYQYLELLDTSKKIRSIQEVYSSTILDTNKLFNEYWNNNIAHVRFKNLYFMQDTINIELNKNKETIKTPFNGSVTSRFGKRWGKMHKGIDIKLKVGDDVLTPFGGRVRYAKYNGGGYGNLIIIRHYNGLETYYAHLSEINVKPNQELAPGQIIGKGGNTGHSTGSHLHFEVRFMGNAINPEEVFDFNKNQLSKKNIEISSTLFTYQKYGVKEEIDNEELLYEESNEVKKQKVIESHKTGKRKKNPNGYYGNM